MRHVLAFAFVVSALSACEESKAASPRDSEPVTPEPAAKPKPAPRVAAGGTIEVLVDATGYRPDEIRAPANAKVTLAFKRTTEQGCGDQLVIASLGIEKQLPVNVSVPIEITTPASGEVGFACGMDMYRGKVVVGR